MYETTAIVCCVVMQRTTIYISAAVISFKFTSSQDVFTLSSNVASAKFMLALEQSCMLTEEKIHSEQKIVQ